MDHHCVWLNNCVGLGNMKPYLLFLFYSVLTSIISTAMCLYEVLRCYIFDVDSCIVNRTVDDWIGNPNNWVTSFGLLSTVGNGVVCVVVLVT